MSGGDLALAAEVFRRYDADGSGRLDRDELLAALRDLGGRRHTSLFAAIQPTPGAPSRPAPKHAYPLTLLPTLFRPAVQGVCLGRGAHAGRDGHQR